MQISNQYKPKQYNFLFKATLVIYKMQLFILIKIIINGRSPEIKINAAHFQVRHSTEKCKLKTIKGKYVECIDIMEEIVSIKKNVYGIDHFEFISAS